MAKREVYICDGQGCHAVLLKIGDGFVLRGSILSSGTGAEQTTVMASPSMDTEVALCKSCMMLHLEAHIAQATDAKSETQG